jgi:hypothetical protein
VTPSVQLSSPLYRLTPEVTLRAGYPGYRAFGDPEIEHHATASMVWARRWR